jgi:hypothetical protein
MESLCSHFVSHCLFVASALDTFCVLYVTVTVSVNLCVLSVFGIFTHATTVSCPVRVVASLCQRVSVPFHLSYLFCVHCCI